MGALCLAGEVEERVITEHQLKTPGGQGGGGLHKDTLERITRHQVHAVMGSSVFVCMLVVS